MNARMIVNGEGTQSMQVDLLVIGLGYVGLPLVREATNVGLNVVGYDIGQGVVDLLNDGRSHVDDISDSDVQKMLAAGFRATSDETAVGDPDTIVICVPTPLSEADGPDLTAVRAASETGWPAAAPGHAGGAGVHHLPGHHRRRWSGPSWKRRPG